MFDLFYFFRGTAGVGSSMSARTKRQDSATKTLFDGPIEEESNERKLTPSIKRQRMVSHVLLRENVRLRKNIKSLERELVITRAMLEESRNFARKITEMIKDQDDERFQSTEVDDGSADTEYQSGAESTIDLREKTMVPNKSK